jgi:cobalt-zinc-cadmium efflux system membrane fusion protein
MFTDLDENLKQRLITGMFVEAAIVVDSKGLAIPTEALITENNKNFVLLFKEEKITLITLKR